MPHKKKPRPSLKKPRLSERERGRIQGLHEAGVSARDIDLLTDRSRDTGGRVVAPPPTPPKKLKRQHPPLPTLTAREAGGGSVMVWAAYYKLGKSPTVVLKGRQNSEGL